jgi:hypothetical protein
VDATKAFFKSIEIGSIIRPVVHFNIQITGFFVIGKVVLAMDGKCENSGVISDNGGRAVSLMNITVDNQDILGKTFGLHGPGGDHTVVQPAKPLAVIMEGMVGSAAEIDGNPI